MPSCQEGRVAGNFLDWTVSVFASAGGFQTEKPHGKAIKPYIPCKSVGLGAIILPVSCNGTKEAQVFSALEHALQDIKSGRKLFHLVFLDHRIMQVYGGSIFCVVIHSIKQNAVPGS